VPSPYSEAEGLAFIERQRDRLTNGEGLAQVVAEASSDRAVGQIVLLRRQPPAGQHVAGVGYWIVESARQHGYATHAVTLLAGWALSEAGLARLEALVEPTNVASHRLLQAVGFRREGVLRSYLGVGTDAVMYSLLRSDVADGGSP